MYLEHFGLERPPFKITPDTSLFYKGNKRGAALEALKYAITSGEGIIKVVGEVGSGKTMLCRMLEIELPKKIEVVYIANPSLSAEIILHVIAFELKLDITNNSSKFEVMQALQTYLLKKHTENKQVVVFVEEAQSMPIETLEEIRLLSNLETSQNKLLQMVLFGQPELDIKLREPSIRQLKERITHSFYLDPFPKKDIYDYLNHRMRLVGYKGPNIFSQKVANNIQRKSKGLTRRINILADKSLLAAYSEGGHGVYNKHINIAARDSEFGEEISWKPWLMSLLVIAVIISSVWVGTLIPQDQLKLIDQNNKPLIIEDRSFKEIDNKKLLAVKSLKTITTIQNKENIVSIDEKIKSTGQWLNKADGNNFTIQLILLDIWAPKKAQSYLELAGNALGMNNMYLYIARIQGREVYSMLYGEYGNRQEAVIRLNKLPNTLRKSFPYLRTIKGIKADIRKSQNIVSTTLSGALN